MSGVAWALTDIFAIPWDNPTTGVNVRRPTGDVVPEEARLNRDQLALENAVTGSAFEPRYSTD
jgi:hypothetical protein